MASPAADPVAGRRPFAVAEAAEHLAPASPWRGRVERLLWDRQPGQHAMHAATRAAGIVAVHHALAREDVSVISVSAAPELDRRAAMDAALEIASAGRRAATPPACSLFDLPLGAGHSWEIVERQIPTRVAGERHQRITDVSLPAWTIRSKHDLESSPED